MSKLIHYKFVFEVLSEEEIDDWEIGAVVLGCTHGNQVGKMGGISKEYLNKEQMAKKLTEFDSEPEFFGLEDDDDDAFDAQGIAGIG